MTTLKKALSDNAKAVSGVLDDLLPLGNGPESRVVEAMRYTTLAGGKRIRPFMVTASADLFNVDPAHSLRVAAAIEMVHSYSLIHDDLPAMDNDDLRRGKPTCHIKFDEATAILAGDALLTKAFEVLADDETHGDPTVRMELVSALSKASGAAGMVGGQMLDLFAEDHDLKMPEITRLQRMKTGALIAVSCEAGAILGKASENARHVLHAYAHDVGLAFQIADDLLDVEGDEKALGKKTGKDAAAGKATFVSLLGVERAREQASLLAEQAASHLEIFAEKGKLLKELAQFVVNRSA
ncbi:MAG: polyprenyl synthetase family protein [Proteobacteria bacterium]|nr:polyprenyl synthetase family protein [Pseudomonadota bacterium]MDA1021834.1 polyprenyl synthetase family protein [Pseudomonadota bacterium]